MAQGALVLVVDEERESRKLLRCALAFQGFRLFEAETAREGMRQVAGQRADLILSELSLPDVDGVDFIRQVRASSSVPIIVLSDRVRESGKIAALDAGADDYLTKPFYVGELLARVRAVLRRSQIAHAPQRPIFQVGELELDLDRRHVLVAGSEVHLTPIEFRILTTLIKSAGSVVTQRQVFDEVWGTSRALDAHALRVFVWSLRHKIERDPARPRLILTEPRIGYRLSAAPCSVSTRTVSEEASKPLVMN